MILKCIKDERNIETRCKDFLASFKKEVDNRLKNMELDIKEIKEKGDKVEKQESKLEATTQAQETVVKEAVVKEVCHNISDRMARQNI